ncbi:MAG: hypothetical protein U1E76_15325 [Planctomycetota bacterium]
MPPKNHIAAVLLGPSGRFRPGLLLAVYLVQITLSSWLHLDFVATRCTECSQAREPTLTATCDDQDGCHLPSHHHHQGRHRHDEHLGCSLCSPLQSLPAERPLLLPAAHGVALVVAPADQDLITPRVHLLPLARGPPATAPFAG